MVRHLEFARQRGSRAGQDVKGNVSRREKIIEASRRKPDLDQSVGVKAAAATGVGQNDNDFACGLEMGKNFDCALVGTAVVSEDTKLIYEKDVVLARSGH